MNIDDLETLLKTTEGKHVTIKSHVRRHPSQCSGIYPECIYEEVATQIQDFINNYEERTLVKYTKTHTDDINLLISDIMNSVDKVLNVSVAYIYQDIYTLGRTEVVDILPMKAMLSVTLYDSTIMEFVIRL